METEKFYKCDCCGQKIFTADEIIILEGDEQVCPACVTDDCSFVHGISEGDGIMKDQFDENVPDDLVSLPDVDNLTDGDIKVVVNATWYDVYVTGMLDQPVLCASAKAINHLSDYPVDGDGEIREVLRINDVLKRWDTEYGDGFYHA